METWALRRGDSWAGESARTRATSRGGSITGAVSPRRRVHLRRSGDRSQVRRERWRWPGRRKTGRRSLAEIPDSAEEAPKQQISKRVRLRGTVWRDARLEPEGGRKRLAANHLAPELVGPEGQSASAAEVMWSRAKGELRTPNVRRPVGDDYAPPLAELIWRPRNARGPPVAQGGVRQSRGTARQQLRPGSPARALVGQWIRLRRRGVTLRQ